MRIFGSDRLDSMLGKLGMKEGEAIVHPWVNKALEKAQGKVEARNFDIRKNLLKFDDVMNDQRKAIFAPAPRDHGGAGRLRGRHATCASRSSTTSSPTTSRPRPMPTSGTSRASPTRSVRSSASTCRSPPGPTRKASTTQEIRERLTAAADEQMAGKAARYGADDHAPDREAGPAADDRQQLARAPRHPRPPAQRRRLPRLRPARPAERVQVRGLPALREAAQPPAHRGHPDARPCPGDDPGGAAGDDGRDAGPRSRPSQAAAPGRPPPPAGSGSRRWPATAPAAGGR